MHSIIWFFATGRFDPAWVQALVGTAALFVTTATLAVLVWYACDTHSLAKASVKQMKATEQQLKVAEEALKLAQQQHEEEREERATISLKKYHHAYAALLDIQLRLGYEEEELNKIGILPRPERVPLRPADWPEIAASFYERTPETEETVISLGSTLQLADHSIFRYWNTTGPDTQGEAILAARRALSDAMRDARKLTQILSKN